MPNRPSDCDQMESQSMRFSKSVSEVLPDVEDWDISHLLDELVQVAPDRGVIVTYAHCETMYLIASQPRARSIFHRVDRMYVDGVGAQIFMFMLDGRWRHRFTAEDYINPLCERMSSLSRRVAFVGDEPGRTQRAARGLTPLASASIELCLDGYADVACVDALCRRLRESSVRLVVLGLGQPFQEQVGLEIRTRCPEVSVLCVGALFTQLETNPPIARRLRRVGLEWTVRLFGSPRRLAARYLLHPWRTATWVIRLRLQ